MADSNSEQNSLQPNKTTDAFFISFGESQSCTKSLQSGFQTYLEIRKKQITEEMKLKRKRKRRKRKGHRQEPDAEKMWNLRMKFLERVKQYKGIPYAKKYWTPEEEEYNSPLFLDCCALVRRAMWDLKRDFGFKLGPWNQAYMADILPLDLKEEEMKPGDLVFVEGIYYNPKAKQQKHNIVHVEVWLGEGEKTLAARWHKGKVQEFETYKFTSTSYEIQRFFFKSIDTWLSGVCKSFCREHRWSRKSLYDPSKYSIFKSPELDNITDRKPLEGTKSGTVSGGDVQEVDETGDFSAGDTDEELVASVDPQENAAAAKIYKEAIEEEPLDSSYDSSDDSEIF